MNSLSDYQPREEETGRVVPFVPPEGSRPMADTGAKHKGRRWLKIGLLALGGVGLLVLMGLTGYLVYRNALRKQLQVGLKKVDAMMALDKALGYQEADKALDRLERKMPGQFSVRLRQAEVATWRWGRFGAGKAVGRKAHRLMSWALTRSPESERVQALHALVTLYSGERDEAAVLAERGLVHHPRSARLAYVLGMARLQGGELEAAEATLRLAVSYDSKFLPALYHLAVVERLRGRLDLAKGYVSRVLAASPGHEGAVVERALLEFLTEHRIDGPELDRAKRRAKVCPEYEARYLLLEALVAASQGRGRDAASSLEKAIQLRPREPEYALTLIEMETGRDVAAAGRVLLPKWRFLREYPRAALATARLDLSRGRPFNLLERLDDIPRAGLDESKSAKLQAYEIEGRLLVGQWERARAQCLRHPQHRWKPSDPRLSACLQLAWVSGRRRLMRRLLKRVLVEDATKKVQNGLFMLSRHRAVKAASLLSEVTEHDLGWAGLYGVRAWLEARRPRAALEMAVKVARARGRDLWSRLLLAEVFLEAGRRKKAVKTLRGIKSELAPTSPYVLFEMGRLWLRTGARRPVDLLIKRLSRMDEGRIWGRWLSGLAAASRKKWKRAGEKLSAVVRHDPDKWRAWLDLALVRHRSGDRKGARKAFAEAAARGDRAWVLWVQTETAVRAVQVPEALSVGLSAARAFRRLGAFRRASTLYAMLADLMSRQESYNRRKVKRMFRKALEMRAVSSKSYLLYAEFLRRRGKPAQALVWYERAVQANPEDADALYRRLWCMVHLPVSAQRIEPAVSQFVRVEERGSRVKRARQWLRRSKALELRVRRSKGSKTSSRHHRRRHRAKHGRHRRRRR